MIRPFAVCALALWLAAACVPDGERTDPSSRAEPGAPGPEVAGGGLGATDAEDARERTNAVRALGRLEDPALVPEIAASLADEDDGVRAVAIEAMAQAVHGSDGTTVLRRLLELVPTERDPTVRAALARSIGRLSLDAPSRLDAAEALVTLSLDEAGDPPPRTLLGVAQGFEALTRSMEEEGVSGEAGVRLEAMAAFDRDDADNVRSAQIRALALTALGRVRRMTLELIEMGSTDPDPEVRRTVLRYLDAIVPSLRPGFIDRALTDPSPRVVLEALGIVAAGPRNESGCARLLAAAAPDVERSVRIVALRALGRPCPARAPQVSALRAAAASLTDDPTGAWQPSAAALLSLARIDGPSARGLLTRYVNHPSPFVRAYAAEAAAVLDDVATLEGLARDTHPNVRMAALRGLFDIRGHAIDEFLIRQLDGDDPQLLITVAGLLEGSTRREAAAPALLRAFERISAAERETWRDPRRALLERLAELGSPALAPRLEPFVRDYDALVAEDAARILTAWTGDPHEALPSPLPPDDLPTAAEIARVSRTTVILHMRGDGAIVIRLMTDLAPLNATRFVRLAREGYFDGLTFHRWEPNFVIQGGSPGANEYAGDGPYTPDEVGASHWRGTVGASTRGRDTADGQIFINLVDNLRLDEDYTVFGVVTEGMDVVDRVLEGAAIERAEVVGP